MQLDKLPPIFMQINDWSWQMPFSNALLITTECWGYKQSYTNRHQCPFINWRSLANYWSWQMPFSNGLLHKCLSINLITTKCVGCEQFYANQRQCPSNWGICRICKDSKLVISEAILNWANQRDKEIADLLEVEPTPKDADTLEFLPAIESVGYNAMNRSADEERMSCFLAFPWNSCWKRRSLVRGLY